MKKLLLLPLLFLFINVQANDFLWYIFQQDTCVSICDTLPPHKDYVMITVHNSTTTSPQHLWRIAYNDSSYIGKTTHAFYTNRFSFPYPEPRCFPHDNIELTRQGLNTSSSDTYFKVSFGSLDTMQSIVRWREIAYFPYRLHQQKALAFQTYLAIKYGITLDKSDYITPQSDTLWSANDDINYYNRIVGIGCDSTYKWCAKHSVQNENAPTLEIYANDLSQGEYFLIGDNNKALSLTHRDTLNSVLYRTWKIKYHATNTTTKSNINIKVSPNNLDCALEGFALILYPVGITDMNYKIIYPDSLDYDGYAYFNNIHIDEDNNGIDYIGVQGYPQQNRTKTNNNENPGTRSSYNDNDSGNSNGFMNIVVTPNPSDGPYQIRISLSEIQKITIRIYDSKGAMLENIQMEGAANYIHTGTFTVAQMYVIEVISDTQSKQIKYIVK